MNEWHGRWHGFFAVGVWTEGSSLFYFFLLLGLRLLFSSSLISLDLQNNIISMESFSTWRSAVAAEICAVGGILEVIDVLWSAVRSLFFSLSISLYFLNLGFGSLWSNSCGWSSNDRSGVTESSLMTSQALSLSGDSRKFSSPTLLLKCARSVLNLMVESGHLFSNLLQCINYFAIRSLRSFWNMLSR